MEEWFFGQVSNNEGYTYDAFCDIDRCYDSSFTGNSGRFGGGVLLTDPRDTTIANNSFQGVGGAPIEITFSSASEYQQTAATNIGITGTSATNFDRAGIHLMGASFSTVADNHMGQNSDSNAGHYSGIMLDDVTIDSTTYGTVNCNVTGNVSNDVHDTKTQSYGVEEVGEADYNVIKNNQVAPNLDGGVSTVGANTGEGDNTSTQAYGVVGGFI